MWTVNNRTPYAHGHTWIRDKTGRHFWVVAVQATFSVKPNGQLELAEEQPEPLLAPEYTGEPGQSSLRWDSDLLYVKRCTDVVADAHAHCPGGRARASTVVSLRVASINKQIEVHGSRVYYQGAVGLTTTAPAPFVSRPISYEWAFGGLDLSDPNPAKHRIDDRNPIGKGFSLRPDRLIHRPAHAIEYPGTNPAKVGPAGLGPIDPAWTPRRQRGGTYDAVWERKKKPLLPDDYDELYASSAPEDQRTLQPLSGGERVELRGATPSGVFAFEVPRILLAFSTRFGSRREDHRASLATIKLMPESMKVSFVWQTSLYVAPRDGDYLDETNVWEKTRLS